MKLKSTKLRIPRCGVMALLLCLALAIILPCRAQTAEDKEAAALQTDAQNSFQKGVAPFVKNYCLECHGNRKSKGGINFEPALKKPGDSASSKKWMQAFANVNAHDMPPDDEDKQPSDVERQRFLDSIEKIKFLSSRDPGPYVIRRLTKVECEALERELHAQDAKATKNAKSKSSPIRRTIKS